MTLERLFEIPSTHINECTQTIVILHIAKGTLLESNKNESLVTIVVWQHFSGFKPTASTPDCHLCVCMSLCVIEKCRNKLDQA